MRYRKLSDTGDYTLGHGPANFWRDVPQAPAQAVATRLRLLTGEWFLDLAEGTPYQTGVLGKHTQATYDPITRPKASPGTVSGRWPRALFPNRAGQPMP